MKKLLLVMLFLLSSLPALAVRYVVDTKDGYANLREEADSKSKVIKKLKNNHEMVFWHEKGEWFCVGAEPDDNYSDMTDGYIHRSQIKLHPKTYIISSIVVMIRVMSLLQQTTVSLLSSLSLIKEVFQRVTYKRTLQSSGYMMSIAIR